MLNKFTRVFFLSFLIGIFLLFHHLAFVFFFYELIFMIYFGLFYMRLSRFYDLSHVLCGLTRVNSGRFIVSCF
jgi:hypothetical protein